MRWQTAIRQGFNNKGLIAEDKQTNKAAFDVIARDYRRILEQLAAKST